MDFREALLDLLFERVLIHIVERELRHYFPRGSSSSEDTYSNTEEDYYEPRRLAIAEPKDYAAKAKQKLVAKEFESCVKICSEGLRKISKDLTLTFYRASANLFLYELNDALKDIDFVIENSEDNVASEHIVVKVCVLCSLERFQDAINFLECAPIKQEDKPKFDKTMNRLKAQIKGDYDLSDFLDPKITFHNTCASFKGPVKVGLINEVKGRGLLASEDIKAGQLILASKALAVTSVTGKGAVEPTGLSKVRKATQEKLAFLVEDRVERHPQLSGELMDLYSGPSNPNLSCFEKIKKIIELNSFGCRFFMGGSEVNRCGLWIFPSYLNHSCYDGNATWVICGDFLFIRALREIAQNEEILISYVPVNLSYGNRWQALSSYGFECDCKLCNADKREKKTTRESRKKLLKKFREIQKISLPLGAQVYTLKNTINKLKDLRKGADPKLNLALVALKQFLAEHYFSCGEHVKGAEVMSQAHELVKSTTDSTMTVKMAASIAKGYVSGKVLTKAKEWVEILKHDLKMIYGSTKPIECLEPNLREILQSNELKI